jgi:hypothetical protein
MARFVTPGGDGAEICKAVGWARSLLETDPRHGYFPKNSENMTLNSPVRRRPDRRTDRKSLSLLGL